MRLRSPTLLPAPATFRFPRGRPDDEGRPTPAVVFGTSGLGNLFRAAPDAEKRAAVRGWFEATDGPVCVDTAGKYGAGLALETLGRELDALDIAPERVVISNKLGWRRVPLGGLEPTFEPGAWVGLRHDAVQDIGYDGILRCWDQGCELLGQYRPTLASVHDPDVYLAAAADPADRGRRWHDVLDAYRALDELKRDGQVRAVGVGAKDWTVVRDLAAVCRLDWVMIANSLTAFTHPPEVLALVESLAARGVAVVNAAVFHSGFLIGGEFFDYRRPVADSPGDARLFRWRSRFRAVCGRFGVDPVAACVRFAASPPGVAAVALSGSDPDQVGENVAGLTAVVPRKFWLALKDDGLIDRDYPYLG